MHIECLSYLECIINSFKRPGKRKVLLIHALRPSSRLTTQQYIKSFYDYLPDDDVQYLNFSQPFGNDVYRIKPDIVIVNYDVSNYRFTPLWNYVSARIAPLIESSKFRIALVQDDFWCNELLDTWLIQNHFDRVLSPISNNLEVLYPKATKLIDFELVLTGYVDSKSASEVAFTPHIERSIDLGQRVRFANANLGKFAQEKAEQAIKMAKAATDAGFKTDVSTNVEDSIIGGDWIKFLSNSRLTVSMKGGASLNDPTGLIRIKVDSYVKRHPNSEFSQVESKCFPGLDGIHEFSAISPRLFESAVTGTCQILAPDNYLDVLEPNVHYIPLERDFSNVDKVLETMRDVDKVEEIAISCKKILVDSEEFTSENLVSKSIAGFEVISSDSENINWDKFVNWNREMGKACQSDPDLHDLLVTWIHDIRMSRGRRALEKVVNELRLMSQSDLKPKQVSRLDTRVIDLALNAGLREWLILQGESELDGTSFSRLIWPWRTLVPLG